VWGIEPLPYHVDLGNAYARSRNVENCRFLLCERTRIPLPDEAVDVVVSYDVIEHVAHPPTSMREIWRTLRLGGRAILAFPVYDGALSHHLDYIVRLPGIHWLFSPGTLIEAVNSILLQDNDMRRFGTSLQPAPQTSFDGLRAVLPTLNGLGGNRFLQLLEGFAGRPRTLESQMVGMEDTWRKIAAKYALVEPDLGRLASWWHSDADLGRTIEVLTDMTKSREAGFLGFRSTPKSWFSRIAQYRAARILP